MTLPVALTLSLAVAASTYASDQRALLPTANDSPTTVAAGPTFTTLVPPASTMAAFAGANVAACGSERNVMEIAIESYFAMEGGTNVVEPDLVTAGLLRQESTLYDVMPDGTIVPAPGSPCV